MDVQIRTSGRFTDPIGRRFMGQWPLFPIFLALFSFLTMPLSSIGQEDELGTVKTLNEEVVKLYGQGRYADAIPLAEELLAIKEKTLSSEHLDVAQSLNNVAGLYESIGGYEKAEQLYKKSLAIREKVLGPEHPDVAQSLNGLALLCYRLGDYAKAEQLYKTSLSIREKTLDPEHPDVAESMNNLAMLHNSLGDYARAESLHKRSLAIKEKVFGPEHPDVALSLNNLAELYLFLGDHVKAELLHKRSLAIKEKALGPDHPDVALSLSNLGGLYDFLGEYARAKVLFEKALAIYEKALGPGHLDVAPSLNGLAVLYDSLGDYAKAEQLYKRSLAIKEKLLGHEHPDVALSLSNLGGLYGSRGEYAKAELLYKKALAIYEKALGPGHPDVALGLSNLGGLYRSVGDYKEAELLYRRSLAITEKALGPEHPDVAQNLDGLAVLCHHLPDYAKAGQLCKRSLAIKEKVFGAEHPSVAVSLNNLAEVHRSFGNYARTDHLLRRSLAINEKVFGLEHPIVANSLSNLGVLYQDIGDYARAESLLKRSLAIREKAHGPEHRAVAASLNNLAVLYSCIGEFVKAEPFCMRSLAIKEKVLGPEHPDVALSLSNLGGLYVSLGDYAKAGQIYKRSLAIKEKTLGPEHPDVALSLAGLAVLHHHVGDYARAEPLYKRSLEVWEKALGSDHTNVATSLNNLAVLEAASGHLGNAHEVHKRAQEIDSKLIDQVMGFTSEDQKMKFLSTRQGSLYGFMSLVAEHHRVMPSAEKDALDLWLRRKGVILEAQRRFQEALAYSDDPLAVETFRALGRTRAQISRLVFSGPGNEGPEAYRKKIAELEREKEALEAKLSQLSQAFAVNRKIAKADCDKVAKALPPKTLLLEFAKVDMFNFKAKGKEERWLPAHYLAFVLHAGTGDRVGMVDLGDAETIDRAISDLRRDISEIGDMEGEEVIPSSRRLHDLVFGPLLKEMGDVREIFISPDGNLNLIPFEVLRGPDGRYLIEDYTFNYLASGRDILGLGLSMGRGGKALIIGDPDFDFGEKERKSVLTRLALSDTNRDEALERSADLRAFDFCRLPGTRDEVRAVFDLLGKDNAELHTDREALEEVLSQRKSPSILHLATHGFFLKDTQLPGIRDDAFGRGLQQVSMISKPVDKGARFENPLLRSGIALAGANVTLQSGDTEKSDGIVTAEKILGLKLRGCDMVVLSACETGVGEVKTGEGVYGLRRAFIQAGTKGLVMSMWSVPDKETKELMVEFYKNVLSGKMNRCQSLRQAALKQMKVVKDRYGHTNPLYWGAFVFLGEP